MSFLKHNLFKNRKLNVSTDINENGFIHLDGEGVIVDEEGELVEFNEEQEQILLGVDGFEKYELISAENGTDKSDSQPTPEELEAKELGLQFITEGDKIICVDDGFVNLQESNKTYGDTQAEALEAYKKEFIESKDQHVEEKEIIKLGPDLLSEQEERSKIVNEEQEKTDLHTDAINEGQADNLEQTDQSALEDSEKMDGQEHEAEQNQEQVSLEKSEDEIKPKNIRQRKPRAQE